MAFILSYSCWRRWVFLVPFRQLVAAWWTYIEQYTLTDFINEGHLERHIRRMRSLYDQRRQTLVQSLVTHFGDRVKILGENAGMHLMVKIHTAWSDQEIVQRGAQVGVGINPASAYYLKTSPGSEFVLGYAELNAQLIKEGIRRLAQVILDE